MEEKSYLGRTFEGIILFMIFLVIIQTFGEEYFVFMTYSVSVRKYMIIAGGAFDLIFTIEFLFRLFISGRKGGAFGYMAREGGFIDLVTSIPLLIFHSGPIVWETFFAGQAELAFFAFLGGVSFLKFVKVFRIIRTLRFLRPLKFFGKIKKRYKMAPVFLAKGISISITVIILVLIGSAFITGGDGLHSKSEETENLLNNFIKSSPSPDFKELLAGTDSVLFVKKGNETVYRSLSDLSFQETYFNDDFYVSRIGSYDVFLSARDLKRAQAFKNLTFYSIIIGIILGFAVIYRRFFNRHISEVIRVMLKGYKTEEYSTPVRIDKKRKDFETYLVADQYNRKWLPLKRKIIEIKREH
ncbi:MAG TPA: hypothetical protein ENI15_15790 [Spirochaetes bacterium]|nr:hypothetical protein [Spirochaetota bacterium]